MVRLGLYYYGQKVLIILFALMVLPLSAMQKQEKKRKTSEPKRLIMLPNLFAALEIERMTIQQAILELGLSKDFDAIQKLVNNTNDLEILKKILILQINIALFVANRIDFSDAALQGYAFSFPKQPILPTPEFESVQAQWSYLLLKSRKNIKDAIFFPEFKDTIILVRELLKEIGYAANTPLESTQDFKNAIIDNFRILFEHLAVVKAIKPGPVLQEMKKRMGL